VQQLSARRGSQPASFSVLAHDVAGLLAKNRRKRQQLGAALEKVMRDPRLHLFSTLR
jgi:hypothetical protein